MSDIEIYEKGELLAAFTVEEVKDITVTFAHGDLVWMLSGDEWHVHEMEVSE